jgi:hypothetical protein
MRIQTRETLVLTADKPANGVQEIVTELGPALNYTGFTGTATAGQRVTVNVTANMLALGTGGSDFVVHIHELRPIETPISRDDGHIMKLRYTPLQHAVLTLEEVPENAWVWEKRLGGFPVVCAELHSQIAPAAAALAMSGYRTAYVMTDGAALPLSFSNLATKLTSTGLIASTITVGQAFGGTHEAVTLHSALLACKHLLRCDAAIVCQGPGNAGSGTRYGFSGIAQAEFLNTTHVLGGTPIAVARMSGADPRTRHLGLSHHTSTVLALALCRAIVALPSSIKPPAIDPKHRVKEYNGAEDVIDYLTAKGILTESMGRSYSDDPIFHLAAACSGLAAAEVISAERQNSSGS